jgi:preprotein translocase subunit SecG
MYALFIVLHIMAALILILVVLLQSGKAGDLASTFGGATSQTAFGARGAATILTKVTTAAAITFMITSLSLSIISSRVGSVTVMDQVTPSGAVTQEAPVEVPAAPTGEAEAAAEPENEE